MGTFKRFDTHNSGYITGSDLKQVLGDSFEGQDVDKLLAEADLTHDGQISYAEFIEYLRGPANDDHAHAAAKFLDSEIAKDHHQEKNAPKIRRKSAAGGKANEPAAGAT